MSAKATAKLPGKTEAVTRQEVAAEGLVSAEVLAAANAQALDDARVNGKMAVSPWVNGAAVTTAFALDVFNAPVDFSVVAGGLEDSIAKVNAGEMKEPEAMLLSQALALQTIFTSIAMKAAKAAPTNPGCNPEATERWMRMALKAQNQCRMTLETLATIKNPPIVFASQANIAHGPQQVNNGPQRGNGGQASHAHAGTAETVPNQLLETPHGQRLDITASGAPSGAASQAAPVGAVDRAAHRRG